MKNLSDEILIGLFAEGNNAAFDELLYRYKDKLFTYIYSILQNKEQAEDIFQDTFTKVIVTIKEKRYNEKGRFIGFLFRIAHNLIIDIYRQEQLAQFVSPTDAGFDLFNNKNLCDHPLEETISDAEIQKDIRRLIHFLPDNQKEIVMLRYYKNIPFKDIAEMKGISINTALGRMRYAILNMRKMAEEHHISLVI